VYIGMIAFALFAAGQADAEKAGLGPSTDQRSTAKPTEMPAPAPPAPPAPSIRLAPTRGGVPTTARASAEPRAPLQSYIGTADYPPSAAAGREQGQPSFRLTVGPDGRVTGCVILVSSGSTALDSATCRLMRSRARFTPARDASGNPVDDEYFGHVAWRMAG
jgi:protein TonB